MLLVVSRTTQNENESHLSLRVKALCHHAASLSTSSLSL